MNPVPYSGGDQITTENGQGVDISSTCIAFYPSLYDHKLFTLKNFYLVPTLTKPLLFVQKFTMNNNCFVEFWPTNLYVKDQVSKDILLSGQTVNGLYVMPGESRKQALLIELNSIQKVTRRMACSSSLSKQENYLQSHQK